MQHVLSRWGETKQCQEDWRLRAEQVRKRATKMAKSSAGVDGWYAKHLERMPAEFWETLTSTVNAIIETKAVPETWRDLRVVLLPKPDGTDRPITISSTMWRLSMSCVVQNFSS